MISLNIKRYRIECVFVSVFLCLDASLMVTLLMFLGSVILAAVQSPEDKENKVSHLKNK